ncbi:MAG: glucose-6-phosphate dehydrogenase assembly protein OpcA [Actinomycetaceae bacterium]|nr:glucose-6-phosphate dehydrogenase assembly protein OpcA [Actinomycetaceae bacterium]
MIIHMNSTSTATVGTRVDELRETVGSVALGRVLTLIAIVKNESGLRDAVAAASGAARAHPCRIIVILPIEGGEPRVDAEIRVGAEAGLSEIIILRCANGSADNLETLVIPLLLPDSPLVVWWVQEVPDEPGTTKLGAMAQRRITSAQNSGVAAPIVLRRIQAGYSPGDTDLAWTGVTFWRNHLASMLDEPPFEPVERAVVRGGSAHPAVVLLAAWLALRLDCPVEIEHTRGRAVDGVSLVRPSGELSIDRPRGSDFGDIVRPGRSTQRVNLVMRTMESKLIEELREMTPDTAYEEVIKDGLDRIDLDALNFE